MPVIDGCAGRQSSATRPFLDEFVAHGSSSLVSRQILPSVYRRDALCHEHCQLGARLALHLEHAHARQVVGIGVRQIVAGQDAHRGRRRGRAAARRAACARSNASWMTSTASSKLHAAWPSCGGSASRIGLRRPRARRVVVKADRRRLERIGNELGPLVANERRQRLRGVDRLHARRVQARCASAGATRWMSRYGAPGLAAR